MKMKKCVFILFILLNFSPSNSQTETPPQVKRSHEESAAFSPELIRRQAKRVEFSRIEKLMDILEIKSGMTVVDVGAGSGAYAYKFAERLKGTGRVFATDIEAAMVNYLNNQAQAKNLTNLFPVLVKSEGLDEFYTKERFDLVFVAHAYSYIHDRINFFKRLKSTFSQNGRLVVLQNKACYDFSVNDVSDFDGLIKQLSSEEFDSPFYSCLQESTRQLLHRPLEDATKESLRKAIIADFNKLTKDVHFLSHFLKDGSTFKKDIHFSIDENNYVYWALKFLRDEEKIIDNKGIPNVGKMTEKHFFLMKLVNTVLIVQEFRKYLYNGRPAPYLPHGYGNWGNKTIIGELTSAGYSLKSQYDFIPFEIILVFLPNEHAD